MLLAAAIIGAYAADAADSLAGEARFLGAFDDVPLAPGLVESPAMGFSFESRDGRILEAGAVGAVQMGEVVGFYESVLPAFGWSPAAAADPLTFARGRERLTLILDQTPDQGLEVRFRLVVAPASAALN
jgi:hypothetical protein